MGLERKALTQFPAVLDNLAKNLTWTSSLGEAYHNQASEVMAAVQTLRAKAKAAVTSSPVRKLRWCNKRRRPSLYSPRTAGRICSGIQSGGNLRLSLRHPGIHHGDVAAAVIGFGAGIALGALAGGGCCGWGGLLEL